MCSRLSETHSLPSMQFIACHDPDLSYIVNRIVLFVCLLVLLCNLLACFRLFVFWKFIKTCWFVVLSFVLAAQWINFKSFVSIYDREASIPVCCSLFLGHRRSTLVFITHHPCSQSDDVHGNLPQATLQNKKNEFTMEQGKINLGWQRRRTSSVPRNQVNQPTEFSNDFLIIKDDSE